VVFPQTRLTLIERLARGGGNTDWWAFLCDYWGPVCRFARQRGNLSVHDAEDVAAETLEVIVRNDLLARWSANRSAKLGTLICTVILNILSNRARVKVGREILVSEHGGQLDRYLDESVFDSAEASIEMFDAFFAAWVEDLLSHAVEGLLVEYSQAGKEDYCRVLYLRICEETPFAEIAAARKLPPAAAYAHFHQVKQRLADRLQDLLRCQVHRYSSADAADAEFEVDWYRPGDYLREHGGLEASVRRSYFVTNGRWP
jgi:DNA-directed RNA polymerase specialized sigma24 family protein